MRTFIVAALAAVASAIYDPFRPLYEHEQPVIEVAPAFTRHIAQDFPDHKGPLLPQDPIAQVAPAAPLGHVAAPAYVAPIAPVVAAPAYVAPVHDVAVQTAVMTHPMPLAKPLAHQDFREAVFHEE